MVREAVAYLRSLDSHEADQILQKLQVVYDDFLAGGVPARGLRTFYEAYKNEGLEPRGPAGLLLEDEFRILAENLSEEEWCTGSYLKLEAGIEAFFDGKVEVLEATLEALELVLEQAWNPYFRSPISDKEVTAETVLGHQFLVEGVLEWQQALGLTRAAINNEADWDDALEAAQYANRILVVLQNFSTRIQSTF